MKKSIFLLILMGLLVSCGASKIERQVQKAFKGDWVLTNVEIPSALVDITLFQDEDLKCFRNSDWHFIANNNKGSYEIHTNGCAQGRRDFRWNVKESAGQGEFYFTLKPEIEGQNARHVQSGYRLKLSYLEGNQMTWEQNGSLDGQSFVIRMHFDKN